MRMALAGMNSVFFTPFNMLRFLMQLTTDRVLFIDFRDPRDFGRLKKIDRDTLVLKASTARYPCSAHAHHMVFIIQCFYRNCLVH